MTANQPVAGLRRLFRSAPLWCAALTLLLSGLTILGWLSGTQILASVRSSYIPMAPSTAACFCLVSIALLLQLRPRLRKGGLMVGLGLVVLLVAVAKLLELVTGASFGIDAWLVRDPQAFGAVLTGRMAPLTAGNFIFLALGVLALTRRRTLPFAGAVGTLTTAVSIVILAGYAYGTPMLYGGVFIPVALPTAIAFLICGIGVVAAAGESAWPVRAFMGESTRAVLMRAFVPTTTILMFLDGLLRARLFAYFTENPAVTSAISTVCITLVVIAVVSIVSKQVGVRIDSLEKERNLAQADLVALNTHLEQRVRDRTRELSDKHEQMGEELRMARELQIALLPHEYPIVTARDGAKESALDFLSFFFPSGDVSGDFFTVFPLGQKAAGIIICDVMGHGVRAALITGMVRVLVEEHAQTVSEPGELLTRINHGLTGILKQAGATMFATCFYLVADVEKGELRYANAGHPQPLRVHQGEHETTAGWLPQSGTSGPAMGLFPNATYRTVTAPMRVGDLIVLYTDGLFEVENADGDILDQEDLLKIVERHAEHPPEEILAHVVNDVRTFSQTAAFEDDVCVVGLQIKPEAFMKDDDSECPEPTMVEEPALA